MYGVEKKKSLITSGSSSNDSFVTLRTNMWNQPRVTTDLCVIKMEGRFWYTFFLSIKLTKDSLKEEKHFWRWKHRWSRWVQCRILFLWEIWIGSFAIYCLKWEISMNGSWFWYHIVVAPVNPSLQWSTQDFHLLNKKLFSLYRCPCLCPLCKVHTVHFPHCGV